MTVLKLVLKKEWFDLFESGIKKEEYREPTNYIIPRILKLTKPFNFPQGMIKYTSVAKAYWFCRGYKDSKSEALEFLIANGAEYRKYDAIQFQLGYKKNPKRIMFEFNGVEFRTGNPEWGAIQGVTYFVLVTGKRIIE